jgi:hypothetical protein
MTLVWDNKEPIMKVFFINLVTLVIFMISYIPFAIPYTLGYPMSPVAIFIGGVLGISCILSFSLLIVLLILGSMGVGTRKARTDKSL